MSFEQFPLVPPIHKSIQECGYTEPTPVQAASIPLILDGKDVIASAQTGTGKTAAFVIPALQLICTAPTQRNPLVLVLTPTRELAEQVTKSAITYGKHIRFNIVNLMGGMPYREQLRKLSNPLDMVVATPGRLLDHLEQGRLDLSEIKMLVLDEADRMLDMGFIDDVKKIAGETPDARQTLLFSATVDQHLIKKVQGLLKSPTTIDFANEKMTPTKIKQRFFLADDVGHKNKLFTHFLENDSIFKAIIFSSTKIHAGYLARDLRELGYEAAPLHGDLKQSVRLRTVDQLKKGKIQFIVATDVAARGIDIQDLTHVINYDLPRFAEDYVHRIGRTGRAGKTGIAISFVMPNEARHLRDIEKYMGQHAEFEVIEGLEPTRSLSRGDAGSGKKKKPFSRERRPRSADDSHRSSRFAPRGDRDDKPFSRRSAPRFEAKEDSADRPFRGRRSASDEARGEPRRASSRFAPRGDRDDRPASRERRPSFDEARGEPRRTSSSRFAPRQDRDDRPASRERRPSFDEARGEPRRSSSRFAPRQDRDDRPFSSERRSSRFAPKKDRDDKPAARPRRGGSDEAPRRSFRSGPKKDGEKSFSGGRRPSKNPRAR